MIHYNEEIRIDYCSLGEIEGNVLMFVSMACCVSCIRVGVSLVE